MIVGARTNVPGRLVMEEFHEYLDELVHGLTGDEGYELGQVLLHRFLGVLADLVVGW